MDVPVADNAAPVEPAVIVTPEDADAVYSDPRAAARALANVRWKRDNPENEPESAETAAPVEAAEQPNESAPADAAPPQEATGETQEANPVEEPPLELPRSWSKDATERWSKLDRETQQFLLDRDRTDSAAVRKAQNEAAEQRKANEAERVKLEQARQQYEVALPALLQTLQAEQQGQFADIKTMADVERLAREDWPRYALWDAQQKKIAAVAQEVESARSRQAQESQAKWSEFASKQDQLLLDRAPELSDSKRKQGVADAAVGLLKDVGFSDQELANHWNGEPISLRDHRIQLLILDGVKYREAKANSAKVVQKPVPPVQKPGAAKPAIKAVDAEVQELTERFNRTGNPRDGAALLSARRRAQAG